MSKSRSKGCIYGTPICIKGGGGSRTIGIPDPLGTHKRRATARRPRAAQRRGLHPARAAGCDIYATLYPQCNSIPFPAPGPRSGHKREREAGTSASAKREHMERIAGAARCDIFATLYPRCNSRAAAHNLCASMRTTYACTTQARLRQYVALTYRVPLISIRGSLMNIYLTIDLTIIMG